jgi:hypothetical protein
MSTRICELASSGESNIPDTFSMTNFTNVSIQTSQCVTIVVTIHCCRPSQDVHKNTFIIPDCSHDLSC